MQSTENKQTTHLDVDAIRARADAATEGPWDHLPYDDVTQAMSLAEQTGPHEWQCVGIVPAEHIRNDDAEFIAHARTDVPNLLDALAAERDRADRAVENLRLLAREWETMQSAGMIALQQSEAERERADVAESAIAAECDRADRAEARISQVEAICNEWKRNGEQPDLWIAVNKALSEATA